ncbi:hypothetical protein OPV22_013441 [Ensete ventricosum]|uniref:DUF4005 domain-containing protein n=1 Tax=Ensete ventricosum TaxID=4639 RepID=A0AAV8R5F8_ENSVE|nr:hypothetical protein OPV22_013441 [Ensete ventricosum]
MLRLVLPQPRSGVIIGIMENLCSGKQTPPRSEYIISFVGLRRILFSLGFLFVYDFMISCWTITHRMPLYLQFHFHRRTCKNTSFNESSASQGDYLISPVTTNSHGSIASPTLLPFLISEPSPVSGVISTLDKEEPSKLDGIALVTSHLSQAVIGSTSSKETSNGIEEQPATKAQAAFHGHLARRAFRALKGIIRLQVLIHGHLVRRQAVATLHAMEGIVKLLAAARGRSVRCTFTGLKITTEFSQAKTVVSEDFVQINT